MRSRVNYLLPAFLIVLVSACSSGDFSDIDKYMAEIKSKPQGIIEPIPLFKPYKAFRYNAASKRSPFEIPVKIREIASLSSGTDVSPDFNRVREQLEAFNLEGISMVGTLERSGTVWALVDDGSGSVHQVLKGNYLGKNHGRIVEIHNDAVAVIELISNGKDSWIERPRTLKLKEGS